MTAYPPHRKLDSHTYAILIHFYTSDVSVSTLKFYLLFIYLIFTRFTLLPAFWTKLEVCPFFPVWEIVIDRPYPHNLHFLPSLLAFISHTWFIITILAVTPLFAFRICRFRSKGVLKGPWWEPLLEMSRLQIFKRKGSLVRLRTFRKLLI